jgi:hypothetical protein
MPHNNYGRQLTCLESRECQWHMRAAQELPTEKTVPLEVVN